MLLHDAHMQLSSKSKSLTILLLAYAAISCMPPYGKGWGIRQGGESNSPTPWAAVDHNGHVSFELNLSSRSPLVGHELPAKYQLPQPFP
jgi:hypothetical protein